MRFETISLVLMVVSALLSKRIAHSFLSQSLRSHCPPPISTILRFVSSQTTTTIEDHESSKDDTIERKPDTNPTPPWTDPTIRLKSNPRFRQHVNPLANKYQQPADLHPDWPTCSYADCSKPLHLDIGCGKGGYLWNLCNHDPSYNYLGLEIRPAVAAYAKQRVLRHDNATSHQRESLDYIGCNANVDLGRILSMYRPGIVQRVTIQFPDPHFKKHHAKRRVVTDALIQQLAQSTMPEGGLIFLQSDVKDALDYMRLKFDESPYFTDELEGRPDEYVETNVIGVATEREICVLEKNMPVFRSAFHRNAVRYSP